MPIEELDLKQESRLSVLETKMDEALPLIRDLHADLLSRKARWQFMYQGSSYVMWVIAGIVSMFGISNLSTWLGQYPKPH